MSAKSYGHLSIWNERKHRNWNRSPFIFFAGSFISLTIVVWILYVKKSRILYGMSDIKSMGNEHKNVASGIWIPALPILISTTVKPESADGVTYKSYKDPPDGPFCVVTSKHGDHCGGIIVRYGVINTARLEQMNNGLNCYPFSTIPGGKVIYIRRDQGCDSSCTKDLC